MPTPRLEPAGEYDGQTFTGDLSGVRAPDAHFLECTFTAVDLGEAALAGARLSDVTLDRVTGAGMDVSSSTWLDVRVEDARLGAPQFYDATCRRLTVTGGKIEFANFRGANLREVRFVDCLLIEPDFSEATLQHVTFDGVRLTQPDFRGARCKDVNLRGAEIVAPQGISGLRGASVNRAQLLDLAEPLARELGIVVL